MGTFTTISLIQTFILCFGIVGFVIPFFLAIWVYSDATKNKIEIPIVWAFLTFGLSIFGIIIYLVAKHTQESQRHIGDTYESFNRRSGKVENNKKSKIRSGPIETY